MKNLKLEQKSQTLTLSIDPDDRVTTELAGGLITISELLLLEEEDVRLQYKHLNLKL
jgi:hypothetical protein